MFNCNVIVLALVPLAVLSMDCSHMHDGNYEIGCRYYSRCSNGQEIKIECHYPTVYSNVTSHCDDRSKVPPPCGLYRDCRTKPDASYADFLLNCTSYYTCFRHLYYGHNFCTPGTVFDNNLGTCNWPADVGPCRP